MKPEDKSRPPEVGHGIPKVTITLPGGTAQVKTAGGTGSGPSSGVICAMGTATAHSITAMAQVIAAGATVSVNPPQLGAAGWASTEVTDGEWTFPAISGVACGPSSNPVASQIVVWAFNGVKAGSHSQSFSGVCASATDCEGSGGGIAAEPAGETAVETVALQWSVLVADEETHSLAVFQEPVLLTLRPNGGERCVWDNGANGMDAPLVELSCEIPLASIWEVRYRHGTVEILYVKLAVEINTLGANRFAAHPDNARHKAVASPKSLLVVPV